MSVERHCVSNDVSMIKGLQNVEFNTKTEGLFHSSTLGLAFSGENPSHVNPNDFFFVIENVDLASNKSSNSTTKSFDGEQNRNSNLFSPCSFNVKKEDSSSQIVTENEVFGVQDHIQNIVDQKEVGVLCPNNFLNSFDSDKGKKTEEIPSKLQAIPPSVSAQRRIPCKVHKDIQYGNIVVGALEARHDVAGAQKAICTHISEDVSAPTNIEHSNEHHETQQHHSIGQKQQQQQQQQMWPNAPPLPPSLPLYNQTASQQAPISTPHVPLKAISKACYPGGHVSRNNDKSDRFFENESTTSLSHASPTIQDIPYDAKSEPFVQPRMPFATQSVGGNACSMGGGKQVNAPKGDGVHPSGPSHLNSDHFLTQHSLGSGGNFQSSTVEKPLPAPFADRNVPLMPFYFHPYPPCAASTEADPRNIVLYMSQDNMNKLHPVSSIPATANSNSNPSLENSLANAGGVASPCMTSKFGNVLIDYNSSEQGVPPQVTSPVAGTQCCATEKLRIVAMPQDNLGPQSTKNTESVTPGTLKLFSMTRSTQPPTPLCSVAAPYANYFFVNPQLQSYPVPSIMNFTIMTTGNGGGDLVGSTHSTGNEFYPKSNESEPHSSYCGNRRGNDTASVIQRGIPCASFAPPPTAVYDSVPQSTPSTSISTGFSPLSSYTTVPLSPNYPFVSNTPTTSNTSGGSRALCAASAVDTSPVKGGGPPPATACMSNLTPHLILVNPLSITDDQRRCANVHGRIHGVARYIPYNENAPPALTIAIPDTPRPSLPHPPFAAAPAHVAAPLAPPPPPSEPVTAGSPETVTIFFQMFPCELRDRRGIINRVIAATCGPDVATVISAEPRSETSFVSVVRTRAGNHLMQKLRCRVLMDRHGFWYADTFDQYKCLKEYCEAIRRLPQQNRHYHTGGLPCMPLVVELSRSVGRDCIPSDPAPCCFDTILPITTVDRHRSRHSNRMIVGGGSNANGKQQQQ